MSSRPLCCDRLAGYGAQAHTSYSRGRRKLTLTRCVQQRRLLRKAPPPTTIDCLSADRLPETIALAFFLNPAVVMGAATPSLVPLQQVNAGIPSAPCLVLMRCEKRLSCPSPCPAAKTGPSRCRRTPPDFVRRKVLLAHGGGAPLPARSRGPSRGRHAWHHVAPPGGHPPEPQRCVRRRPSSAHPMDPRLSCAVSGPPLSQRLCPWPFFSCRAWR
jgi:hypothetical protein